MRIISGSAKGTKLNTISEKITRPTLDRIKEPMFSIIQNNIVNATVLDLFAGSGALGLESLSRGATIAYACDKSYKAIKIIKENAVKTRLEDKICIINKDYLSAINQLKDIKFDLIFIDPPYEANIGVDSIYHIYNNNMINDNGIIILETDQPEREVEQLEKIKGLEIKNTRKYGRVTLLFIEGRG